MKFKIAMFNHIGSCPFEEVTNEILTPGREWLIVERCNKALFISQGNISSEHNDVSSDRSASSALYANTTLAAFHFGSNKAGTEAKFLLSGLAPAALQYEGTFFPACGIATLSWTGSRVALSVQGHEYRHSALHTADDCAGPLSDPRCDLSLGKQTVLTRRWGFEAQHRAWANERMPVLTDVHP
jgi:hypothetical protein